MSDCQLVDLLNPPWAEVAEKLLKGRRKKEEDVRKREKGAGERERERRVRGTKKRVGKR